MFIERLDLTKIVDLADAFCCIILGYPTSFKQLPELKRYLKFPALIVEISFLKYSWTNKKGMFMLTDMKGF